MRPLEDIRPAVLESRAVVRFQDCDPYGHLNNSRYLDYFVNAREDQVLDAYGFDIYAYSRKTGLGWVVSQNQVAYVKPALLMEQVILQSQLVAVAPKFIHIEMRMYDLDRRLKSLLWVHLIHIDIAKGKSAPHPEDLQAVFDKVCMPVGEGSFDKRLAALLQQGK
jgi:acyl-CoA thioester hydrolase